MTLPFTPPVFGAGRCEHVVVRLLRRWAACRQAHEPVLPPMVQLAGTLGVSPVAAIALASVFELTEALLERRLLVACCCEPTPSRDERAVLMLLAHAPEAGPVRTSRAIPHGLAAPLIWAARSARLALGEDLPAWLVPASCPFASDIGR